jgi:hypothetical protein
MPTPDRDLDRERLDPPARAGAARPARPGFARRPRGLLLLVVGALLALLAMRFAGSAPGMIGIGGGRTTLSQEMVVDRVRDVAQLVSSEMTVRDVVTFENTSYGSTKRALLVVTGKIFAGIDLQQGADVQIDASRRHITITIPEARVLAVDIVRLQTYDEQRGLWNPFEPSDRDTIYGQVRRQLFRSAAEMGLIERANRSAARMLETMFTVDGYTAEIRFGAPSGSGGRDTSALRGEDA